MTPSITELDVVSFLNAQAEQLAMKTGTRCTAIQCEVSIYTGDAKRVNWRTYVDGGDYEASGTLAGALNRALQRMDPAVRAKEMRDQAAKLFAEADALLAGVAKDA